MKRPVMFFFYSILLIVLMICVKWEPANAQQADSTLTGHQMFVVSGSGYIVHEVSLGFGAGPEGTELIFDLPKEVRVNPKNIATLAYHYNFGPHFALGLRFSTFTQKISDFPVQPFAVSGTTQTLTLNSHLLTLESRWILIRGTVEPYGGLLLGIAFGNIAGEGPQGSLQKQNYAGLCLGIDVGGRVHLTRSIDLALEIRTVGASPRWNTAPPPEYKFNGEVFNASYTATFLHFSYRWNNR